MEVDSSSNATGKDIPSVYTELLQLRNTFTRLREVAKQDRLHLLDDDTLTTLDASSSSFASSSVAAAAPHLYRQKFKDKIRSLRRTARAWQEEAIQARDANQAESSSSSASSSTFARYLALHKDKAQNVAQFTANMQPLEDLRRQIAAADDTPCDLGRTRLKTLPAILYAGALKPPEPLPPTRFKRKRETDGGGSKASAPVRLPYSDRGEAFKVLDCLAAALEELAAVLGLETFAEKFPQAVIGSESDAQLGYIHAHTLTQGGKLLVLDIELGLEIVSTETSSPRFHPTTRVKLSFTNRTTSGHTSPIKNGDHPLDSSVRAADLLRNDVETLAKLLFGLSTDGDAVDTLHMSSEELRLRLAISHWHRYRNNLKHLLELDRISSTKTSDTISTLNQTGPAGSGPCDCFAALHQVAKSLEQVATAEDTRFSAAVTSQPSQRSMDREADDRVGRLAELGHGAPFVHSGVVGISVVYSLRGREAGTRSVSRWVQDRGLCSAKAHEDHPAFSLSIVIEPQRLSLPLSSAGAEGTLLQFKQQKLLAPLPDLGSSTSPDNKLGFTAKLDPPVPLPRRLVTRIARTVGLPIESKLRRQVSGITSQTTRGGSTYGSLLSLSTPSSSAAKGKISTTTTTPSGARLRYQTMRLAGATADDQDALLVSSIPFRSLSQLYLLLEVLQEATAVQTLLESLSTAVVSHTGPPLNVSLTPERAAAIVFAVRQTDVNVKLSAPTDGSPMACTSAVSSSPFFAVHLSARLPPVAGRFFILSCYIHRDITSPKSHGWRVTGGLCDALMFMGGSSGREPVAPHQKILGHHEIDEEIKIGIGALLAQEAHLSSAADLLLSWAYQTIDTSCDTTASRPNTSSNNARISLCNDTGGVEDRNAVLYPSDTPGRDSAARARTADQDQMILDPDPDLRPRSHHSGLAREGLGEPFVAQKEVSGQPQAAAAVTTKMQVEGLQNQTQAEPQGLNEARNSEEPEACNQEAEPVVKVEAAEESSLAPGAEREAENQAIEGAKVEEEKEADAEEASSSSPARSRRALSSPISPRATSPKSRNRAAGSSSCTGKEKKATTTTTLQVDTNVNATANRSGRGGVSMAGMSPGSPNSASTRLTASANVGAGASAGTGSRSSTRRTSRGGSTPSPSPTTIGSGSGTGTGTVLQHAHAHQHQTRRRSQQAAIGTSTTGVGNGNSSSNNSRTVGSSNIVTGLTAVGTDDFSPTNVNSTTAGSVAGAGAGAGAEGTGGGASGEASGPAVTTRRASALSAASSACSGGSGSGGGGA